MNAIFVWNICMKRRERERNTEEKPNVKKFEHRQCIWLHSPRERGRDWKTDIVNFEFLIRKN